MECQNEYLIIHLHVKPFWFQCEQTHTFLEIAMSIIRSLTKQRQLQESEENADVTSLTESQESGKMIKSFLPLNFYSM